MGRGATGSTSPPRHGAALSERAGNGWGETSFLPDSSALCPRPFLFPVLLHFLQGFARVGRTLVRGIHVGLVYDRQGLLDVVLHRGDGGADGLAAEAVRDQAEVGQAGLDVCLQDRRRPVVPVGRSVLVEELREFFAHLPARKAVNTHTCELDLALDRERGTYEASYLGDDTLPRGGDPDSRPPPRQ